MQRWTIWNLTPARLIVSVPPNSIQGLSAGRMEFAPLERIVVEAGSGAPDHPSARTPSGRVRNAAWAGAADAPHSLKPDRHDAGRWVG
jgi:hypothetical protein